MEVAENHKKLTKDSKNQPEWLYAGIAECHAKSREERAICRESKANLGEEGGRASTQSGAS